MASITVDSARTLERFAQLQSYVEQHVLSRAGSLCCVHHAACRASVRGKWKLFTGQCSYLGESYDTAENGRPWRILVVPMQTGTTNESVDLNGRRRQVHRSRDKPYGSRNPHMRGVTKALKVLRGIDPDTGPEEEWLDTDGGPVHLFDAFAMANATLCSRIKLDSKKGQGSRRMLDNCKPHLRETIRLLEPTIIHSQGRRESGWSTHTSVEKSCDEVEWVDEHVARVRVGSVRAIWVSLRHPSMQWSGKHLKEVVLPSLEKARAAATDLVSIAASPRTAVGAVPELVRSLYGVVGQLEDLFPGRKFTPDGHLVGSIGEVLAAHRYGLTLHPGSTERHDATAPDGRQVQIKATQGRTVGIRAEPDHLIVLKLQADGGMTEIYNGPGALAWRSAGRMQKNGQRPLSVSRLRALMAEVTSDARLARMDEEPR